MFELLGISLLLAALLTFNSCASVMTAGLWRLLGRKTRRYSAMARARLLFALRVVPALLAIMVVIFLLVPSYLAYEPRQTDESVSFKLGLLAFVSAVGLSLAIARGIAAWRATARLTADWLRHGERITLAGIKIATFRIEHAFPVIAIVGVVRPRLFIASHVLELLTAEEIAAAVAHENSHLAAHDNLKRGLLRACRDMLLIIPSGRSLDRSWAEAAEEAADESAARRGRGVALDLASALVKIARKVPSGARPTMPAGVFLIGEELAGDEASGIKIRVGRLMALAGGNASYNQELSPRLLFWILSGLLLSFVVVVIVNATLIFSSVHSLIEHAVFMLR
jgi:Zn-dependent protease with chaperone function